MTLNKFSEGGNTFYQLYINCPICHGQGRHTERSFWRHADNNCNGVVYIGDNAFYQCMKCGQTSHVKNWTFDCPVHSSSPDNLVKEGSQGPAQAVSTAGQMAQECGFRWLQTFLFNMGTL